MSNDYSTLLLALLMGYQLNAPLWNPREGRGSWLMAGPVLSLAAIGLVPELSFTGLRIGWLAAGVVLCSHAVFSIKRGHMPRRAWFGVWDGAGSWVALVLAGANPLAVLCGAGAGLILPIAVGPWPGWLRRMLEPAECILMGAVGLRSLLLAGLGPAMENWPLLLLTVPWLILWDWPGASARSG